MEKRSFLEALKERYADSDVSASANMFVLKNMNVAGTAGKVKVPCEMSLHRERVNHAGDTVEIREICQEITSLDLTCNNLTDWEQIFLLLSCMPKLRFFNLSENDLRTPLVKTDSTTFPNIKTLVLNSTSIPMETVDTLLEIIPNVTELHLCRNGYRSVNLKRENPNIQVLFLNRNNISSCDELLKLSSVFPNMKHLLIMRNPLSELSEPEQLKSSFTDLECLSITNTSINSWTELEKLKHFTSLTDIRMTDLPLYEDMEEKLRRQLIIGFLPKLKRLNLSNISCHERETAERVFIRHFMDQDQKPSRFSELQAVHGKLDKLVEIDMKVDCQRTVEVHYKDKVVLKVIDISQTVGQLKQDLAKEIAGLPSTKLRFFHESQESWVGTDDLKCSLQRSLHQLHVADGDKFYIEPK